MSRRIFIIDIEDEGSHRTEFGQVELLLKCLKGVKSVREADDYVAWLDHLGRRLADLRNKMLDEEIPSGEFKL